MRELINNIFGQFFWLWSRWIAFINAYVSTTIIIQQPQLIIGCCECHQLFFTKSNCWKCWLSDLFENLEVLNYSLSSIISVTFSSAQIIFMEFFKPYLSDFGSGFSASSLAPRSLFGNFLNRIISCSPQLCHFKMVFASIIGFGRKSRVGLINHAAPTLKINCYYYIGYPKF